MIILGLTGSIGMGKSTTAKCFKEFGAQLWDADAAVGRLYSKGGAAVEPLSNLLGNICYEGSIDRDQLRNIVMDRPEILPEIEKIVHPLVKNDRIEFITRMKVENARFLVLDIPLLFEMSGEDEVDYTIVVSAPYEVQQQRVLARPGMNQDRFDMILSKQMPDSEKRDKADYIVMTDSGIEAARQQVENILQDIGIL